MVKKITEENLEGEIEKDIKIEEDNSEEIKIEKSSPKEVEVGEIKVEEVETKKPTEEKSVFEGAAYTVYRNEGDKLFLVDSKKNGFKIPTPEQYKNVKKGDIVYIK